MSIVSLCLARVPASQRAISTTQAIECNPGKRLTGITTNWRLQSWAGTTAGGSHCGISGACRLLTQIPIGEMNIKPSNVEVSARHLPLKLLLSSCSAHACCCPSSIYSRIFAVLFGGWRERKTWASAQIATLRLPERRRRWKQLHNPPGESMRTISACSFIALQEAAEDHAPGVLPPATQRCGCKRSLGYLI